MRTSKKLLALLLAVIMVVGLVMPASANAANDFVDIDEVSANHLTAVTALVHLDLMQGHRTTGRLAPQDTLTRAEAVTFIQRLATGGVAPPVVERQIFSDVRVGQWHAHFITWAYNNNIVVGFPDGSFRPDAQVTNAEFAAMVLRAMGYDRNNEFAANWPNAVVAQATSPQSPIFHGLVNFHFNSPARREQAAQMVFNALPAAVVVWNAMANAYQFQLLGDLDPTGIMRYQTLGNRGWGFRAPHQHSINAVQVGAGVTGNNYTVSVAGETVTVGLEHVGHFVAPYMAGGGIAQQAPGVVTLRVVSDEVVVARGTGFANVHAQLGLNNQARRTNSAAVPVIVANQQVSQFGTLNLNVAANVATDPRHAAADALTYANNQGEFNLLRAQSVRYVIHGNAVVAAVVNPVYTTIVAVAGPASNRTITFPQGLTGPIAITQGTVGGNFNQAQHTLRNNSNVNLNTAGQQLVNVRWTGNAAIELTNVEVLEGRIIERHRLAGAPGGVGNYQNHRFVVGTRTLAYSTAHGAPLLKGAMTEAQRAETLAFDTMLLGLTDAQIRALPSMNFFVNATNGRVFAVTSAVAPVAENLGIITEFVQGIAVENNVTVNRWFANMLTSTGAIVQVPVGNNANVMLGAAPAPNAVRTIHVPAHPTVVFSAPDAQGFHRAQPDAVVGRNFSVVNHVVAPAGDPANNIAPGFNTNNLTTPFVFDVANNVPVQIADNTRFIYLEWNANLGEWVTQHTVVGRHPGIIAEGVTVSAAGRHDAPRNVDVLTDVFVFAPYVIETVEGIFFMPAQTGQHPIVHGDGHFYHVYEAATGTAPANAPPLAPATTNRSGVRVTQAYTGPDNVFVQRVRFGPNQDQYRFEPISVPHANIIFEVPATAAWSNVAFHNDRFQSSAATTNGILVTGDTVRVHINRYQPGDTQYTMDITTQPGQPDGTTGLAFVVLENPMSALDRDRVAVIFLLGN